MPKKVPERTDLQVRRLSKQAGFHNVGGVPGLYLDSKPPAASWILRVKVGAKRRDIGLGGYPDVTLAQAREKAREARRQIEQGIDPVEARKAVKAALIAAQAKAITFEQAARKCHAARVDEFRNEKHKKDWITSLELYAFPVIGALPVGDVEQAHAVRVLEPIWTTKTETATRVRQRCELVLEWARVAGYRNGNGDNPFRWKGTLEHVLPRPSRVRKVEHHAALPWQEVPEFMAELRTVQGMGARALEFAILTAARSGEVRFATWDEIDLDAKLWTIPGERMKAGRTHRVPLSEPAIRLLKGLPRVEGSPYVFPSARGGPLSDMTLSAVCRRMNVPAVPHGFRSSFKDWARSSTSYADEVSELALAHVNDDKTRAAYARDELLPKRTRLMRDWARFLSTVSTKASVTPIRGRA